MPVELNRRTFLAGLASLGPASTAVRPAASLHLETSHGWYLHNGKAIWGYAGESPMWGGYRGRPTGWWTDCEIAPSVIRNDPGHVGPNRTEDLDKLTDNMLAWGLSRVRAYSTAMV